MKHIWIRLIAMLMLSALCVTALASCQNEDIEDGDTEPAPTEATTPAETFELDASQALIVSNNKETEYVVVYDDAASKNTVSMIDNFRNQFKTKTGATLTKITDKSVEGTKEIVISSMDGRGGPDRQLSQLTAPSGTGYRIAAMGDKIVVGAKEDYLAEALELLLRAVCDCGNGLWGVPKEYVGKFDIPTPYAQGTSYYVGEGNYLYTASNSVASDYALYLRTLESDGFICYTTNTIGQSQFATYIKDDIYGNMMVYLAFHPTTGEFRMTYGPMEYLPNSTPIEAASVATPTITQMHLQMVDNTLAYDKTSGKITATNGAPGMSYLLQLSDGRFIVIDGGNTDGIIATATQDPNGNWVVGDTVHTGDKQRLYDTMDAMAGEYTPTIAVWFISHAHGDHMNLATDFVKTYRRQINLEMVAYNFPAYGEENVTTSSEGTAQAFRSAVKSNFPQAQEWIMHTGQQLFLPGCEIEVFATQEDYVCTGKILADDNQLNVAFRVTLGNTSFMVLGDTYPVNGEFMADSYGDALESDILQLSHHGFNGGVRELYQYVDPKICFWPCDQYRYEKDSRNLGTASGYDFNYWLRHNPWTRSDGSSASRQHYTASYMTTINALTMQKM